MNRGLAVLLVAAALCAVAAVAVAGGMLGAVLGVALIAVWAG